MIGNRRTLEIKDDERDVGDTPDSGSRHGVAPKVVPFRSLVQMRGTATMESSPAAEQSNTAGVAPVRGEAERLAPKVFRTILDGPELPEEFLRAARTILSAMPLYRELYELLDRASRQGKPTIAALECAAASASETAHHLATLASLEAEVRSYTNVEAASAALTQIANELVCSELKGKLSHLLGQADSAPVGALITQLQELHSKMSTSMQNAGLRLVDGRDYLVEPPTAPEMILEGTFDRGDKVAVIGSAKLRKSFFVQQLALALAAGEPKYLQWDICRPRNIFLAQLEVKDEHYHRRLFRMARRMRLSQESVGSRLHIYNGRGEETGGASWFENLAAAAIRTEAELIVIDPIYKLSMGDENSASEFKGVLREFDRLAERTGAAVMYIHHDAKGVPGERNLQDRGAGSNVLARDYDCGIFLSPHRTVDGAIVVEILSRNYPPQTKFVAAWDQGNFLLRQDLVPHKATRRSAGGENAVDFEDLTRRSLNLLRDSAMPVREFRDRIQELAGTQAMQRKIFKSLMSSGLVERVRGRGGDGDVVKRAVPNT